MKFNDHKLQVKPEYPLPTTQHINSKTYQTPKEDIRNSQIQHYPFATTHSISCNMMVTTCTQGLVIAVTSLYHYCFHLHEQIASSYAGKKSLPFNLEWKNNTEETTCKEQFLVKEHKVEMHTVVSIHIKIMADEW